MPETIQPVYHAFDLGFDTEDEKRVAIKQDSDKTHILVITLYTNDDQMDLNPNWEYHITMRKPDGRLIVDTSNIEIRDDKVYVTCTAQMLSAPGTSVCELVIFNNSQQIYSNNFYIYVSEDLIDGDTIESTNEFNSIVDVLRLIQEYARLAEASKTSAADSESAAELSADNAAEYERQIRAILDSLSGWSDEIEALIAELEQKSSEIDDLKRRILDSSDDIENLLKKLEDMGLDQLEQLVVNARSIYDNMVTLNDNCTTLANGISTTAQSIEQMAADISTKCDDTNTKYTAFLSQINDINIKMQEMQAFLDEMDQIKTQIIADRDAIATDRRTSDENAAAIASYKTEIEEILEELREAQQQGFLDDPIIISDSEPDPDVQKADDMWLKPYE